MAAHGGAVGRRGWGSARPPAPACSGPGARWDRTAVPCHRQLFPAATGAREGRVTTHFPRWWGDASLLGSSSGILCQRRGWNWGKGQNELRAVGSPMSPTKGCISLQCAGYGKGVPPCQHILSLPWQWLPPEYRVGKGQASPTTSAWGIMPSSGFRSFRPLCRRVTGRGRGVW